MLNKDIKAMAPINPLKTKTINIKYELATIL